VEHLTDLHSNSKLLALLSNIRLQCERLAVANTRTYYILAIVTAVKRFKAQAQVSLLLAGRTTISPQTCRFGQCLHKGWGTEG
jgi:hypothetical protein